MSLYNVLSTDYYSGMLEIVKNSLTLAEIHKEEGGAFQFKKKYIYTGGSSFQMIREEFSEEEVYELNINKQIHSNYFNKCIVFYKED